MPTFSLKTVLELLVQDIELIQRLINSESEVIGLVETLDTPILGYLIRRAFVQLVIDIGERVNLFRDINLRRLRRSSSKLKELIKQVRLFDQNPEVDRSIANFRRIVPTAEALFNEIFLYFQDNIGDFLEQAVHPLLEHLSEERLKKIQIPLHQEGSEWQDSEWPVIRILAWCRNKLEHFYMYESNAFIIQEKRAGIREKRISDYSERLSIEDIFQCISAEMTNWEEIASISPEALSRIESINSEHLKLLALRNCYFTITKMWADYYSQRKAKIFAKYRNKRGGGKEQLGKLIRGQNSLEEKCFGEQPDVATELHNISETRGELAHSYLVSFNLEDINLGALDEIEWEKVRNFDVMVDRLNPDNEDSLLEVHQKIITNQDFIVNLLCILNKLGVNQNPIRERTRKRQRRKRTQDQYQSQRSRSRVTNQDRESPEIGRIVLRKGD